MPIWRNTDSAFRSVITKQDKGTSDGLKFFFGNSMSFLIFSLKRFFMKSNSTFSVLLTICAFALVTVGSCDKNEPAPECTTPNSCDGGFECVNNQCECPEGRIVYYQYCAGLGFEQMFMARGGCECQDSLLWALDVSSSNTANPEVRNAHFPTDGFSTINYRPQTTIIYKGVQQDSFLVLYPVSSCDSTSSAPVRRVSYASGVFTSDSTGYMHLDWQNKGDSLPYRRCTMPFTRIK